MTYIPSCSDLSEQIRSERFASLDPYQLQKLSDHWRKDYNHNHPHKSLGNKSPKEYMPRFEEEFKCFFKSDLNENYLSNFKVS
jgi:putative transposase